MLESRNSYGYGYVGTYQKGFEWHFTPSEGDPEYRDGNPHIGTMSSGYVYPTEEKAMKEGNKWLKSTIGTDYERIGVITAIKTRPPHFEY